MSPRTAAVQTKEKETVVTTAIAALVVAGEFHLEALENGERRQIEALTAQLHEAKKAFVDATLKMGEVLSGVQEILEPRGAFTAYLKTLGGLSKATAYRYIGAYQNLKQKFPEPILVRVVSAGLPMYGASKKQPFGVYTKAVSKTPLPKGILTDDRADQFVASLQERYRKGRKAARTKTATERQEESVKYVLRNYNRMSETERLPWLREVLSDIAKNIGLSINLAITPGMSAEQVLSTAGGQTVQAAKSKGTQPQLTH